MSFPFGFVCFLETLSSSLGGKWRDAVVTLLVIDNFLLTGIWDIWVTRWIYRIEKRTVVKWWELNSVNVACVTSGVSLNKYTLCSC